MKTLAHCILVLAGLLTASCGDNGGDSSEFSTNVAVMLLSSGVVPAAAPVIPSQVTVITSAAQLATVAQGRFALTSALANFNFAEGDIVYVEVPGDQDPSVVARISTISSGPGGEFVNVEACGSGPRASGPNRPYVVYGTSRLPNYSAYSLVNTIGDCATVRRLPTTFVSAGSFAPGIVPVTVPTVIRSQADLDLLLAQVPSATLPAQYRAPNFAQTNLLYIQVSAVQAQSNPVDSYVRMLAFLDESDASFTALVEHCDNPVGTNTSPAYVYAVYAIAPVAGDVRIATAVNLPPGCATAR